MGEDVGWNRMGATVGLAEKFGKERVRNTPISEAGFVGAAAGAAMVGVSPVVDMLIAPFVYVAFDQFVSIIAKSTYLYGGQAKMPVTVRAPMLYGSGNAAQHSDRPYATFMTIPGLKLIAPATPYDVKGMLTPSVMTIRLSPLKMARSGGCGARCPKMTWSFHSGRRISSGPGPT
jgi:acetoin:2,6-dichlorophenolindophenol oxidoreductase subunit beta